MTFNTGIPAVGNQISADIPDIEENFATLPYINIWVPATAMVPLASDGAEAGENEYATYDVIFRYMAFDGGATEEEVSFSIVAPENWNRGTLKAKFYWTGSSGCSDGDTVEWQIQAIAFGDGDTLDAAYTDVGEVISDAVDAQVEAELRVTSATPAITVNGTPALGDMINFKIIRNTSSAGDVMAEDAWLFGCMLQLTRNEAVAGW